MEIKKVYSIYFSATYTTRKVVREIALHMGAIIYEYDITAQSIENKIEFNKGDVLVIGVPVYGGRIPKSTLLSINKLVGNNTPAIITCVYGNRDYDDALLELRNEVEAIGFKVVSAGAFIARHSIFSQIAKDRPNTEDMKDVCQFAICSKSIIESLEDFDTLMQIDIKGNIPYKVFNQLPIYPLGNESCIDCGVCVSKCPVGAIPSDNPKTTNEEKCLACGRCIVECLQDARDFRGEFFDAHATRFLEAFSSPKENEKYYAEINN